MCFDVHEAHSQWVTLAAAHLLMSSKPQRGEGKSNAVSFRVPTNKKWNNNELNFNNSNIQNLTKWVHV